MSAVVRADRSRVTRFGISETETSPPPEASATPGMPPASVEVELTSPGTEVTAAMLVSDIWPPRVKNGCWQCSADLKAGRTSLPEISRLKTAEIRPDSAVKAGQLVVLADADVGGCMEDSRPLRLVSCALPSRFRLTTGQIAERLEVDETEANSRGRDSRRLSDSPRPVVVSTELEMVSSPAVCHRPARAARLTRSCRGR